MKIEMSGSRWSFVVHREDGDPFLDTPQKFFRAVARALRRRNPDCVAAAIKLKKDTQHPCGPGWYIRTGRGKQRDYYRWYFSDHLFLDASSWERYSKNGVIKFSGGGA